MGKKGGGGGNIAGFKYSLSMLMGLSRGPLDEIVRIKVGDLEAWNGSVTANGVLSINAPNLFGGDEKEGGVVGDVDVMMGDSTQSLVTSRAYYIMTSGVGGVVPPSRVGEPFVIGRTVAGVVDHVESVVTTGRIYLSALRGTATAFFDGVLCANSPYPKKWEFRVRRALKGWYGGTAWYPDEAQIALKAPDGSDIIAMNPAHIVYECFTNPEWGRGLSPDEIDETSFISAANTLCREKFGMCIAWARTTDLGEFIQQIYNHIGAGHYQDRNTGKIVIRLLRKDYVADDLPLFTYNTGLLQIVDDDTSAPDNSHSEIVVNWTEPVTNTVRQTRVQNIAGTQANQTVTSTKVDYLGLPTSDLAARVAQRDLLAQTPGIKRFTLKMDRRGRKLTPLCVFRISVPDRNIDNMVLRAVKLEEGGLDTQTVTVSAVQDVFGLEETTYLAPPEDNWTPPDTSVQPISIRQVQEGNYRDLVRALTPADLATVTEDMGAIEGVAKAPTNLSTSYELETAATGEDYADQGAFLWTPTAVVTDAIGYYDTDIVLSDADLDIPVPSVAWLEDELVEVTSYDPDTGDMVIGRGAVDTVPVPHAAATRIWFPETVVTTDGREYTTGEEVRVKLLTRTNSGLLDIADAAEDTVDIVGRQGRPYPPGAFTINGDPFAETSLIIGDITFAWTHRDRVGQADHVLVHGDASTGPEAGTTYTIRIYNASDDALLRTTTGITGDNWTYDGTMKTADMPGSHIRVELESVRDGLASYQHYNWTIAIVQTGYGYGYGYSYGKV